MAARQVQTSREPVTCEICGRSLLRGEFATPFRDGTAQRVVCELCTGRAFGEGWVREGASITDPVTTRTARARSLVGRLRARLEEGYGTGSHERSAWPPDAADSAAPERHVHAVPADTGGQLGRAVTLFNGSEHVKMIAGVIRSLGAPHVQLGPSHEEFVVDILIAWELCWYRFEADLDGEIVRRRARGYELSELEGPLGEPNAAADPDGRLALAVPPRPAFGGPAGAPQGA
jgi:hypothetical protein